MQLYRRCYKAARQAKDLGLSVLPVNENGTKSPLCEIPPASCTDPGCIEDRGNGRRSWRHRNHRRATCRTLERWFLTERRKGLGLVCGEISGGLLLFEFEGRALRDGTFDRFIELAVESGLGELVDSIRGGYEEETPSGGVHWLVFVDEPLTLKLASTRVNEKWLPLIETKGEGGVVIIAPSGGAVHPTGREWRLVDGGLDTIVRLTSAASGNVCALDQLAQRLVLSVAVPPDDVSADHRVLLFV